MKLNSFKHQDNYLFEFDFEDGTHKIVDLSALIKSKVSVDALNTARIDKD